jgi:hypothetical protein
VHLTAGRMGVCFASMIDVTEPRGKDTLDLFTTNARFCSTIGIGNQDILVDVVSKQGFVGKGFT